MTKLNKLGIYIHIPFCVRKCNYCDFVSGSFDEETKIAYVQRLCNEIKDEAGKFQNFEVDSVFFGGGTPSVLDVDLFEKIFSTLNDNFRLTGDCEISMECNPGTADYNKLCLYKNLGINRLSLGLQSCNDNELKALGRIHNYNDFSVIYDAARKAGFENINVDLMGAIPLQTIDSFEKSLIKVRALDPEHISVYSLIVEEGTPFYDMDLKLPNEEDEREMVRMIPEILGRDFAQYEISNYSKRGFECRHNIKYWKRDAYLGFGCAAASLVYDNITDYPTHRYKNIDSVQEYIRSGSKIKHIEEEHLSKEEAMSEYAILGLRMNCGIVFDDFKKIFGYEFKDLYKDSIDKYLANGLLENNDKRIALTSKGRDLCNIVFSDLI